LDSRAGWYIGERLILLDANYLKVSSFKANGAFGAELLAGLLAPRELEEIRM
jgi:hypothetical protein